MERGAALTDSAEPWRSSRHPGTGYDCEKAAVRGGMVVSAWVAAALDLGICREFWPDFYHGYWGASAGRFRSWCGTDMERAGWDAFPGKKYADPWEHLAPSEAKQDDKDEQTRRLRAAL